MPGSHSEADDTRPIKVGGYCRPTEVGQHLSAVISCHTRDFYEPIIRLHMSAT